MRIPKSTIHGFPRIGASRELKAATEGFWAGRVSEAELLEAGRQIRATNWTTMAEAGVELIPSNDFSFYDQVLDTAVLVNVVPERYRSLPERGLTRYFAMARGHQHGSEDVGALEMTKWFNTNYHHLVPELSPDVQFRLAGTKVIHEFEEAAGMGIVTKPVLIGPITFLLVSKVVGDGVRDPLALLPGLLAVYEELLRRLHDTGAEWVQFDEPVLAATRTPSELQAVGEAYRRLSGASNRPSMCISTYFDHAGDSVPTLMDTDIEGIGLDFCAGAGNLTLVEGMGGLGDKVLFAGIVDGRNVWANRLERSLGLLEHLNSLVSSVVVSSSCSFQHVPLALDAETAHGHEIRNWLAFAHEKLEEVTVLARGLEGGRGAIAAELEDNQARLAARAASDISVNPTVRARATTLLPEERQRQSPYSQRRPLQRARLRLPALPTTTIGSFPQTRELRAARAALAKGTMSTTDYEGRIRTEIDSVIALQDRIGLDVFVHGEPERNDMVQYFAEQLDGFLVTDGGWVQSFGTRYIRPPIIVGDVSRPDPMTVRWTTYAQSRTHHFVKGMLTGPVTMLLWSFARDDMSQADTCRQIALAVRDEVADLDQAGVAIIQVDEPAFREGLPLHRDRHDAYLKWATECFRLATAPARDETQIHTHMCYAEFGSILTALEDLDVDVISFEAARSHMELLDELHLSGFDRDVGPGIYDIHSPRVPTIEELRHLLAMAVKALPVERLWVNPDCGLKTRTYEEIEPSLVRVVEAARNLRDQVRTH